MLEYVYVGDIRIPSYGMIILVGLVICNMVAQIIIGRDTSEYKEYLILEVGAGIGAIIGARLLSILEKIVIHNTNTSSIKDGGYSYYGGLVGFFCVAALICKIRRLDTVRYSKKYIFLLPLLHFFWKIGCFMGGCCFGIPYSGAFAIIYPQGVNELSGISVFPTPLLEAVISIIIMCIMVVASRCINTNYDLMYLLLYSISRFFIEYLRYHGSKLMLSMGQIYSLICGSICIAFIIYRRRRAKQ